MDKWQSPLFLNVTNWNEKRFYQTKGTRDKCIVENPENKIKYYFKTSLNQGLKNYKYEFWSEIIASYLGKYLKFNILEYNIAQKDDKIGCLSKEMTEDNSILTEGISLFTSYDNSYNPNEKKSYSSYTLDFIYKVLRFTKIKHDDFNKMILFDFIIGNSDRHQENWGFLSYMRTDLPHKLFMKLRNKPKLKMILKKITTSRIRSTFSKYLIGSFNNQFAPIYDSGSSLGRELSNDKIDEMLVNKAMFKGFINRAQAEIRKRDGLKYKQNEIIKEIKERDSVSFEWLFDIVNKVNIEEVKSIIYKIDHNLPANLNSFRLPNNRKELIYRIICERINIIKSI